MTSIKKRFKSSIDSLKQVHGPPKVLTKVMTLQIRKRPKRQIITKRIFSTKKTIIFTEAFYKYMQVNTRRHFRILNKVQVLCIQTKSYTRKISSQIMKKKWLSLKIMLAKLVAKQTSLMLVSVHLIFMSSLTTL